MVLSIIPSVDGIKSGLSLVMAAGAIVGGILFVWIALATVVQRFHDLNLPGWAAVAFAVVLVSLAVLAVVGIDQRGGGDVLKSLLLLIGEGSLIFLGWVAHSRTSCEELEINNLIDP